MGDATSLSEGSAQARAFAASRAWGDLTAELGRALTRDELVRYSRHILLPQVGEEGQRALKRARVLLVGAGGLGSPAALYLAAAGVGTIGLVDFDTVDLSNLQRQILHGSSGIGGSKLDSAHDDFSKMIERGIIDPLKARSALENAVSIAGMVLTTNCLVTGYPE